MSSYNRENNRRSAYGAAGYGSEFESDSEVDRKKAKRNDLAVKELPASQSKPSKSAFVEERSRDEARYMRHHYISTNAYARHKELVNNYLMYYGGELSDFQDKTVHKTDRDVIRENHQFVWEEGEEGDSWDKQLAKKYYDKLYKEYCVADMSRYKENKIGLRWRVQNEVITGKGQFVCGNKKCDVDEDLKSWEVNFAFLENEIKKNCLVKLRLCPRCSDKLNYTHKKREITKEIQRLRAEGMQETDKTSHCLTQSPKGKGKHQSNTGMTEIIDGLLF